MSRVSVASRLFLTVVLVVSVYVLSKASEVLAYSADGYSATDFVIGFPVDPYARGPIGLAFDATGNLYVISLTNSTLYKFSPSGGVVSSATEIGTVDPRLFALAFGADGNLYASTLYDGGVYQISTSTGAIVRTIAYLGTGIRGLALDPISGDLFVASSIGIERIANYEHSLGTVSPYTPVLTEVDGLNFGPDGTLYAADVASQRPIAIAGTNTAAPGSIVRVYPAVPGLDGIGVALTNPFSTSGFLVVTSNYGVVTKIDTSTTPATLTAIFTGGSRGDFTATGADGCLYATQSDRIVKISNSDGTCSFYPSNPFLGSGAFVVGDQSETAALATGSEVTFWGSQWRQVNAVSAGSAPAAFKGFADIVVGSPPSCGDSWITRTGNSSQPPATIPRVMAVLVTSSVSQANSTISGNITEIVLVRTDPGYAADPGRHGTGSVIGVLCRIN